MTDICSCLICRKEFSVKGIHTHYARTHLKDTRYSSGNNGKYKVLTARAVEKYNKNPKKCEYCEKLIPFENKSNRFCDSSCGASFNNQKRKDDGWTVSIEQRKKISESLTGKTYIELHLEVRNCLQCNKNYNAMVGGYKRIPKFCSKSCGTKYSNTIRYEKLRLTKTARENYKRNCNFKFSIKDFPNEFDFSLLEQHGMYKAKNRGNNLNGISRDHMVSVMWGFRNNIPPEHIAHPANCRLIVHNDNVSKGDRCSITYEELLERINVWDIKYPRFV